jgi:hypothetical protein
VKLHLEITVSNHVLSTLDGALKGMLYTRNEAAAPKVTKGKDNVTGTLEGVEPVSDLPNLSSIGSHVKSLKWAAEVTGCLSVLRFATTELELDDSTCGPFKIKPKDGGSCIISFPLEAPNASEKVFAKLAKYKSREIDLKVKQHTPADDAQQRLDDARDAKASASKDPAPAAKTAPDKAAPVDEKKGDPGDFENNPFRSAKSDEAPPQSATTEVVPDKPAGRRTGRRVVAAME